MSVTFYVPHDKTFIDVWPRQFTEGIDILLTHKPVKKVLGKACEELSELNTKLLQSMNNPSKVTVDDIMEEIVDVEMHLYALKRMYGSEPYNRLKPIKIKKFLESKDFSKYKQLSLL